MSRDIGIYQNLESSVCSEPLNLFLGCLVFCRLKQSYAMQLGHVRIINYAKLSVNNSHIL